MAEEERELTEFQKSFKAGDKLKALFDRDEEEDDDIALKTGDIVQFVKYAEDGDGTIDINWSYVFKEEGGEGFFPTLYLDNVPASSTTESSTSETKVYPIIFEIGDHALKGGSLSCPLVMPVTALVTHVNIMGN